MQFKVLTVHQPWAYLLCAGIKGYETRTWPTSHRGELLIHAGKSQDWFALDMMDAWPWNEILDSNKLRALEFGAIIGRVTVTDCIKTDELRDNISPMELRLGDFAPKRFGWQCTEPVLFIHSVRCDGKQGLWTIDLDESEEAGFSPPPGGDAGRGGKLSYEEASAQKQKMIRKMLYLGYNMGFEKPRAEHPDQRYKSRAKVCWENIEHWCMSKHSTVKKSMNKMTVEELRAVLSQFEAVNKSFQKSY